jgi:hypothetical protein
MQAASKQSMAFVPKKGLVFGTCFSGTCFSGACMGKLESLVSRRSSSAAKRP